MLSAALALALACACGAVTMRVNVGFDGATKSSYWTPISVELENKSATDVQGTLASSQEQTGDKRRAATFSTEVDLPAHSKKGYHIYTRLDEYGGDLTVTLSDGKKVIVTQTVQVDAASPASLVVVSVGRKTSRLGFLSGDSIQVKPKGLAGQPAYRGPGRGHNANIEIGSVESRRLPDRLAAYEGVDCLVISSSFDPAATNRRALRAITGWVASGGLLVVTTGSNYQPFQNRFFDELLPVHVRGAANLDSVTCLNSMGGAAFPQGPAAVTRGTLKPGIGRSLAEQNGIPIVAERDYGAGRVVFVAFDHTASPFRDWSGQSEFWKSLLSTPPAGALVKTAGVQTQEGYGPSYGGSPEPPRDDDDLIRTVEQTHTMKAPSFTLLGLFLLGYIVALVPVNYFVLRRKRRLELAWATTPAIVLLFSLGAYGIGYSIKGGGLKLMEASIVEGSSNARYARIVTTASLFSPSKTDYDIEINDPGSIASVLGLNSDEEAPDGVAGSSTILKGVGLPMWSSRNLQSVGDVEIGGKLATKLVLDGRRVVGKITNRTGIDLADCCLVYGGNKVDIHDLGNGDTAEADVTYSLGMSGSSYAGPHPTLRQKLLAVAVSRAGSLDVPVLIGAARESEGPIGLRDESPDVESETVYVFRLDYGDGPTFRFDPDQLQGSVVNVTGGYSQDEEGEVAAWIDAGGRAVFVYRIPLRGKGIVTELRINGQSASRVASEIYNVQTGSWDAFNTGSSTIKNAQRYVDANHAVKIRALVMKGNEVYAAYRVEASGKRQ